MSTLLAAALIEYDGQRPPFKLFAAVLVAGLIAPPLVSAALRLATAGPPLRGLDPLIFLAVEAIVLGGALLGLAAGSVLGWGLVFIRRGDPVGLVSCLAVVGSSSVGKRPAAWPC